MFFYYFSVPYQISFSLFMIARLAISSFFVPSYSRTIPRSTSLFKKQQYYLSLRLFCHYTAKFKNHSTQPGQSSFSWSLSLVILLCTHFPFFFPLILCIHLEDHFELLIQTVELTFKVIIYINATFLLVVKGMWMSINSKDIKHSYVNKTIILCFWTYDLRGISIAQCKRD